MFVRSRFIGTHILRTRALFVQFLLVAPSDAPLTYYDVFLSVVILMTPTCSCATPFTWSLSRCSPVASYPYSAALKSCRVVPAPRAHSFPPSGYRRTHQDPGPSTSHRHRAPIASFWHRLRNHFLQGTPLFGAPFPDLAPKKQTFSTNNMSTKEMSAPDTPFPTRDQHPVLRTPGADHTC